MVRDRVAKEAVTEFTSEGKHNELAGLFKLKFDSADAWFEEDERIYVHPKAPYKGCLGLSVTQRLGLIPPPPSASTYFRLLGMSVSRSTGSK